MIWCERCDGGVTVRVKVVPGANRSAVAGVLGDRLKVRIAAPPEKGKANQALCALFVERLGVGKNDVRLVAGTGQARKTLQVRGLTEAAVIERLGMDA